MSPLTALKTVVKEKSTAALPLGISVGVVLNNASWVSYGACTDVCVGCALVVR